MAETFNFQQKIWEDTIQAYLRRKNVFMNLAFVDDTLEGAAGTTVQFPFWQELAGDAQDLQPDQQITPTILNNSNFQITVKEVGTGAYLTDGQKYNLISRASRFSSSISPAKDPFDDWSEETMRQIAFKFATKIDKEIGTLINTSGNYFDAYTATTSGKYFYYNVINYAKAKAFGDRADEAKAIVCHSLQFNDLVTSVAGGMNAFDMRAIRQDIQETGYFRGSYLGVDFIVSDNVPSMGLIGGEQAYAAYVFKDNPFGLAYKQRPLVEHERDKPGRREVITATHWYGLISLNQLISSQDVRTARIVTTVNAVAP